MKKSLIIGTIAALLLTIFWGTFSWPQFLAEQLGVHYQTENPIKHKTFEDKFLEDGFAACGYSYRHDLERYKKCIMVYK